MKSPHESVSSAGAVPADRPFELGLALAGGAARGLFHVGVMRALREAGIIPDVIAGSSAGALIGASHAGPLPHRILEKEILGIRWKQDILSLRQSLLSTLTGRVFPRDRQEARPPGAFCNEPVERTINRVVDWRRFSEIRPLIVTGTDIETSERLWFAAPAIARRLHDSPWLQDRHESRSTPWGPLYDPPPVVIPYENVGRAARVSSCIPGVMQTVTLELQGMTGRSRTRRLHDGGVLDICPVDPLRALGCRRILAVFLGLVPHVDRVGNVMNVGFNAVTGLVGPQVTRSLEGADHVIYDPEIEKQSFVHIDGGLMDQGYTFTASQISRIQAALAPGTDRSSSISSAA